MNASSSVAACRPATTPSGVSMTSTFPALISEMRSQRSGLVDEVGGDEDGDLVAAGQLDQVLPEAVPGHRVHARGRLVEDQQVGPVDQRHGELQALPLAQRQRVGQRVHDLDRGRTARPSLRRARDLVLGHIEELGVQDQVLPHRQLGVEREGLRHVADLAADVDVVGIDRLAEQPGLPLGGRQQAAQHLHRRRLAAAVGAEEAEDLAPLDPEADVIDRDEVAEPLGQAVRLDDHLLLARRRGGIDQLLVAVALLLRQQGDEGRVQVPGPGAREQLRRRAGGEHVAGVHRHQPVEAGGLLHVGGRHQDAHARPARPGCGRPAPRTGGATADRRRWSARRGSTGPGRGSGRSTGTASASCRRTACRPAGRGRVPARYCRAARRCGAGARRGPGRTAGRRSRCSRRPTASGRGSCPAPAACRRCAGRPPGESPRPPCRRRAPRPAPAWIRRAPAISASRLDLPTPSGPISPTMHPAGRSRVIASSACVLPYRRLTSRSRATGARSGIEPPMATGSAVMVVHSGSLTCRLAGHSACGSSCT